MPNEKTKQLIEEGRRFLKFEVDDIDEPTDQELKLPQPPLTKAKMTEEQFDLPIYFEQLPIHPSFLDIVNHRESHRVYTEKPISLLELSFLLWTTQGIKSIRGNHYATLRTVPSGGARHEFETYLWVNQVEGLKKGIYHYLPSTHQIELINQDINLKTSIGPALSGQSWAESASVVFFWTVIPYRSEWRYSHFAHRIILVDIGHVCQNLYLACEAIQLGTCAIGAFVGEQCDTLLGVDGKDEFTILVSPVGSIRESDKANELAFYAFLKENQK